MAKKPVETNDSVEKSTTAKRHSPSVRESRPAMSEPVSKEIPAAKKSAKKAEPKASDVTREITDQMIAERAYFIGEASGGSMDDNWHQAERELKGGM